MFGVKRWVACGPRVVPHPQRLRWVENALDLHTVWLRPAAAGPEAPRSARARRMLKRSPSMGGTAVYLQLSTPNVQLNCKQRLAYDTNLTVPSRTSFHHAMHRTLERPTASPPQTAGAKSIVPFRNLFALLFLLTPTVWAQPTSLQRDDFSADPRWEGYRNRLLP